MVFFFWVLVRGSGFVLSRFFVVARGVRFLVGGVFLVVKLEWYWLFFREGYFVKILRLRIVVFIVVGVFFLEINGVSWVKMFLSYIFFRVRCKFKVFLKFGNES